MLLHPRLLLPALLLHPRLLLRALLLRLLRAGLLLAAAAVRTLRALRRLLLLLLAGAVLVAPACRPLALLRLLGLLAILRRGCNGDRRCGHRHRQRPQATRFQ